jgi:hypothetical protein
VKKTTWLDIFMAGVMVMPVMTLAATTEGSIPVVCADKLAMAQMLEEYGERAMLTMISHRQINGATAQVPTVLFVNRDTQSWTLVERPSPELYCAVAVGDNIRPYQQ